MKQEKELFESLRRNQQQAETEGTLRPKNIYSESDHQNPDNQIHSDVLGSYTGITEEGERPIQDADDL